MALKKPSELFKDEPKKKVEVPEQLEGILPENFDAYKSNVKNIEVLNDFVSSFGTLKENIQKVDNLEEVIQSLKEELQDSITKEDLDTAMMSNLLVLEKNIQKIEFNLKGINRKDLNKIEEEIEDIENKVLYVFEEEFPKYKKALKSNEIFIKDKFYEYSSEIDEKVNQFEEFIANSFEVIKENLQSINNNQLIDIREDVVKSSQEVENQNQLIEKTKKQIFGLEKNVQEFYQKIEEAFQSYQQSQEKKILTLEESISSFGEEEIKKYKSLLQETRIQNDEKIHSFEKNLTEKYLKISQSVSSLLSSVENKSITIEELKENLENIQGDYSRKEDQQKDITDLKEQFTKKINLLENDISFKENKIKKANQELTEEIKKISNQFDDLNVEELKKKYSQLTNKISYIEEVFEKFNEKTILNEGLLDEPPTIKNSDPLTPLDKNYVTLEQLQEHYRLFINRIQQQLSTIGGGGETRLKYLDDIVGIATNASAYDGKFLKYNHSTESFVFETVSGGGGGGGESYWASTSAGIHTLSNVGVGTTAKSDFKLFVEGNAKITGILTVGNQSVTIDGTNNTVNVGSGVTINGNTGIISATAIYVGGSQVSTFSGNYNDLTNKPNLSTISVAYATTAGIATYATTAGIATALQNSRTFEITGDIIASPISFNGTGNVSLAATIQPNSVALGGDTTGDYVQSITGTSNQITVTSGTGESSTPTLSIPSQFTAPQDVTVTRDLQVNRNLNVNGNITIGGTSATLFTTEFKVYDPDIVLGFRTDANNNDVSTDNTANHGGIAVASTEGTPLIQLFDVGVGETNPATYKKFMWFKSGTFAGLGTDAWISNYAIGIGSTQVPNGVRLAAGGMQVTDRTLSIPQLNISGVSTFTGAVSFGSSAFFGDNDTLNFGDGNDLRIYHDGSNSYIDDAGTGSLVVRSSNLYFRNVSSSELYATFLNNGAVELYYDNTKEFETTGYGATVYGTLESQQVNVSGVTTSTGGFVGNLTGTATTATNLADAANITTGTINSARLSGTYDINVSYATTAGIATVAQGLTGTPNITVGFVTATSFVKSGGTSSQFLKADGSVDANTYLTSYTETDNLNSVTSRGNSTTNGISVGILTATSGNFSGIITSSGAVISGATTATSFVKSGGTSSQFLKADGSVDTSTYATQSYVGLATVGLLASTGNGSNLTGIVTSIVAGNNITISGSTGQVTINASGGGVNYWTQSGVGIVTTSNVGIATTNPTSPLTVFGDALIIGIVTATDFNSASDIKLKDNISVIDNPLDKIVKLKGVNFQWKETGKKSLGVIAQEVEKVLPELVSGEESKTVNYNGLIGLLIECVKYQQKEIEELKKFIDK